MKGVAVSPIVDQDGWTARTHVKDTNGLPLEHAGTTRALRE